MQNDQAINQSIVGTQDEDVFQNIPLLLFLTGYEGESTSKRLDVVRVAILSSNLHIHHTHRKALCLP